MAKALLQTFFVSMLPVIELRGGIPFGVSRGLTIWQSFFVALLGNIIIGVVIIALLNPVLEMLQKTKFFNKMAARISNKFNTKAKKIKNANKFFGVVAFIAVPLPLTGVWTGSAIAVFLRLPFWQSVLAAALGVTIAGTIILCITMLLPQYAVLIFNIFLICAVVLTLVFFLYVFLGKQGKTVSPEPN
ncbi:MAG: small multi-drug export protein [Christensenellaceae bacterium]|jgi:uncharacterized membrane protein|nr:small multi-drug export protein [Christensenellaceae bacterium]